MENEKPLYVARYRVYWSETDAAIMMHFSNFFRICERAEEDFLESMGLKGPVGERGSRIILPRVHAECDYFTPLRPCDRYRVELIDVKLGNKSIEYLWRIVNETLNKHSAICKIVAVFYDEKIGKAVPIPEEFRKKILEIKES